MKTTLGHAAKKVRRLFLLEKRLALAPSRSESPFLQHATRSVGGRRGFTLLISVILASVSLAIGLALLDISYKQVVLASSAKQSQVAFYAADAALECALYYDQQLNAFDQASPIAGLTCDSLAVTNYSSPDGPNPRVTDFDLPCSGGGIRAHVQVYKNSNGSTQIYTKGYNTCSTTNSRRIERGLKVTY